MEHYDTINYCRLAVFGRRVRSTDASIHEIVASISFKDVITQKSAEGSKYSSLFICKRLPKQLRKTSGESVSGS